MRRYTPVLIILLVTALFILLGAQCPWKKDSGSSLPSPDSVIPGTWAWDGTDWTNLKPPTEPSSGGGAMVYDSVRDRIVLFGGWNGNSQWYSDETWEFDGTNWIQCLPTVKPFPRDWHAMAYDSARQKTILFGGYTGGGVQNNQTWEWDGTNWIEKFPVISPTSRDAHALAYDAARGKVVLFGGYSTSTQTYPTDTWEWDGTTWTQRFPVTSPPPRLGLAMAYDSARQKVVLFGGRGDSSVSPVGFTDFNDTWEWNGTNWIEVIPTTKPYKRSTHSMVYDSFRQKIVLYGGMPGGSEWPWHLLPVWEYDGVNWAYIIPSTRPGSREYIPMVYDSVRKRMIMYP